MPTKPEEPPHGRTIIHQARGKPVYCVNDANGQPVQSSKPIAYLGWDKSTSRFYVVPSKPKVYLGRNLDEAIWRFRQWVLDHDATAVTYQKRWITAATLDARAAHCTC